MTPTPTRRPYNLRCPACDALNPIELELATVVHSSCPYCATYLLIVWRNGLPRWHVLAARAGEGAA